MEASKEQNIRPERAGSGSLLTRLRKSQTGNVLPMMAAAMVPLAGMIGSGLDMSRAYMVKAKLQNACDTAALAARREMGGSGFSSAAEAEGERFFNFNFPEGTMGTEPVDLEVRESADDPSVVEVEASTVVPTTVMKVIGRDSIAVSVECDADKDYVHNDIMLVLDVTLSMNCRAGTTDTYCTSQQTGARIANLRNAGVGLYRALEDAEGVRTRYGFMPYSMTVNVANDLTFNDSNSDWIRDPASYQRTSGGSFALQSYDHPTSWFTGSISTNWNNWWSSAQNWGRGCVEERASRALAAANTNIRIGADVSEDDIEFVPTTDAKTQWQPYDPDRQQAEQTNVSSNSLDRRLAHFCPARASRLAEYASETAFNTAYQAALARVGGYTFHDLGMVWGMRYLSSSGLFASANPEEIDEIPVQKHIIFMTDGELIVDRRAYSSFGVDQYDNRMTGTGTQAQKHTARFLAACDRAREMGMTVWVIAMDVQAVDDIQPCAASDDHFFISRTGSADELERIFALIGKGIGRLRLTT